MIMFKKTVKILLTVPITVKDVALTSDLHHHALNPMPAESAHENKSNALADGVYRSAFIPFDSSPVASPRKINGKKPIALFNKTDVPKETFNDEVICFPHSISAAIKNT